MRYTFVAGRRAPYTLHALLNNPCVRGVSPGAGVWTSSCSAVTHALRQRRWTHILKTAEADGPESPREAKAVVQDRIPVLTELLNGRQRNYYQTLPTADPAAKRPPHTPKLVWEWAREPELEKTVLNRLGNVLPQGVLSWLRAMFLPVGYPTSVHPVYARVHIYQFFETLIWSSVSVLCSQAMLSSIGVGSTAAAGGAVAIQWILKDGIGEIGKLFFIERFARSFDSHPKTWKLVGEVASLSGAFLQLCTVLAPSSWFLGLASTGYALRSIHFSIFGATHMTFTRNFALKGNVGDLVAKDDSQMSVSHLSGLLLGVSLLSFSPSPAFLFSMFGILTPIHFAMTIALLRAANFEVLNQTTLSVICSMFVKTGNVPSMHDIKPHVKTFGEWIKNKEEIAAVDIAAEASAITHLGSILAILKEENYLLSIPETRTSTIHIPLHTSATPHDVIRATLHATHFHHLLFNTPTSPPPTSQPSSSTSPLGGRTGQSVSTERALALLAESKRWTEARFPQFIADVDYKDWQSDAVFWGDSGRRVEWPR